VRFGNVMGSRGSVIPLFKEQIAAGGPVTVTDEKMSRFMMSISQAAGLVLKTARLARGGDIFILKMPVLRLVDLAQAMIELLAPACGRRAHDIKIKMIGTRLGEKLVESLINEDESRFVQETAEMFIIPIHIDVPHLELVAHSYTGAKPAKITSYSSKNLRPLTRTQIKEMLVAEKLV
jgi:FlaA1/EpsC-like NDP-sugar epimerase